MSPARDAGAVLELTRRARLRRRVARLRWLPAVLGAGVVIWLGLDGFGRMGTVATGGYCYPGTSRKLAAAAACRPLGWSDRLYSTLQLFKGSLNGSPPYPASLELARWLALGTTAYAAYRAVSSVLAERWTRFRVGRLARGHVVVCGLGSCGTRFAQAFRRAGADVVSIELEPTPAHLREHRERGMLVIGGDAASKEVLEAARLHKASALVVCCGDDALNARVALLGRELAGGGPGAARCFVQLADAEMRALLESGSAIDTARDFELFNVFEIGPRSLLDAYPAALADVAGRPPSLVVVGTGSMARSVVTEAARRRSLDAGASGALQVLLVAPDAAAAAARLSTRYPHLASSCRIQPLDLDLAEDLPPDGRLAADGFETAPSMCFICLDDENAGLRATLRLRQLVPFVPLVLCSLWSADAEPLLALAGAEATANVEGIGLLELVCEPVTLLEGDDEVIARAIHAGYVADERRRGASTTGNASLVAWQRLPEELRQSNRDQAAGAREVLARAGFSLAYSGDWAPPLRLSDEEVRRLARIEHERWMRDLLARGWKLGPLKDPAKKEHPALVDFDQLGEPDRERDFDAVRRMPRYLAYHGIAVVRPPTGSSPRSTADLAGSAT